MGLELIKHHVYAIVKAAEELKGITGQRRLAHGLKVSVEASPGSACDTASLTTAETGLRISAAGVCKGRTVAAVSALFVGLHGSLRSGCQLGQCFVDLFEPPARGALAQAVGLW